MRALLGKPRGSFLSGPITESMQGDTGTPVQDMRFYSAPVGVDTFVDQKRFLNKNLAP